ncbi:MAG: DUF2085 domain-containing protein [Anaerolineaceae bacterium]|nr:DUF2085 domain-containing protein [Anaerolineaceae bacterium]
MERVVRLSGGILRRGYALLFAFVFIFYVGSAAAPAVLMTRGHRTSAEVIYKCFRFLCHQYPWRSWFIGGEQAWYPLTAEEGTGVLSITEASGLDITEIDRQTFYGNERMGYKMAFCQRDLAIYGTMAVFSLLFFLSGNRLPRVPWQVWLVFGVLPMGADGLWQLFSQLLPVLPFRESTPVLRTVTGALFGFFTCWYLLPTLETMLREGDRNVGQ